jgi:hypothetical protein
VCWCGLLCPTHPPFAVWRSGLVAGYEDVRTYDLTVDGLHDYFVLAGGTQLLVHNNASGDYCVPDEVIIVFDRSTDPFDKASVGKASASMRETVVGAAALGR